MSRCLANSREEAFAKKLAKKAGVVMLEHFAVGVSHDIKHDKSRVTIADTAINELVIDSVNNAFPGDSVIGEEMSALRQSDRAWVVDPIDGTDPFSRGVPTNVFSLALVERGEPTLGVVYDPHQKRLYSAVRGGGAWMNGVKITSSQKVELDHAAIEYGGFKRLKNFDVLQTLKTTETNVYSFRCGVYSHMMIATGQLEGAVCFSEKPWDAAASKIIIEEAGGVTSDLHGLPQRYDGDIRGFVASGNAEFHRNLMRALQPSV